MIEKMMILLVLSIVPVFSYAGGTKYIDETSRVELTFPSGSRMEHHAGFQKATVFLEKSIMELYSMKSQDKKAFSWNQINEFDAKDRFGKLLRSEKLSGKTDGWARYYASTTKDGHKFITCVVLVRGKDCAFYMVEKAPDINDLVTVSILADAVFPTRPIEKARWYHNVILYILMFSSLLLYPVVKKIPGGLYMIVAVIMVTATTAWSVCYLDYGWQAWKIVVSSFAVWGVTYCSETFREEIKTIFNM